MTTPYPEIDKENIRKLDLYQYKGETIVINDLKRWNEIEQDLLSETIIGFDTERKPSFKKGNQNPVSLIQIATRDKVLLLRLNHMKIPYELVRILNDPEILKIGVGLDDDIQGLKSIKNFKPAGFIDLGKYFRANEYKQSSLKYLAAMVLNVRISKNKQISNWERETLTPAQITYAATDAWIPREIYLALIQDENFPEVMTD
mgnify:CR=1 FL=1